MPVHWSFDSSEYRKNTVFVFSRNKMGDECEDSAAEQDRSKAWLGKFGELFSLRDAKQPNIHILSMDPSPSGLSRP